MYQPVFENMNQYMWLCIKIKKDIIDFSKLDLNKGGHQIEDEGIEVFCMHITDHITELKLNSNNLSSRAVLSMKSARWANLTRLSLESNRIKDEGCNYLAQLQMPKITELNLSSNNFTSCGVSHLSKGDWIMLKIIHLNGCMLKGECVWWLIKGNWLRLAALQLKNHYLSPFSVAYVALSEFKMLSEIDGLISKLDPTAFQEKTTRPSIHQMVKEKFKIIKAE